MENLALTTLLLLLSAHWSFRFRHNVGPPNGGFVRRADHAVHVVTDLRVLSGDKVAVTLTLVNVGDVALFGRSLIA